MSKMSELDAAGIGVNELLDYMKDNPSCTFDEAISALEKTGIPVDTRSAAEKNYAQEFARKGGQSKSPAKSAAARVNGKKAKFRPRKPRLKDVSIFQDIVEFTGPDGYRYKAEDYGDGFFRIFRHTGLSWVNMFLTPFSGNATPEKIWSQVKP